MSNIANHWAKNQGFRVIWNISENKVNILYQIKYLGLNLNKNLQLLTTLNKIVQGIHES